METRAGYVAVGAFVLGLLAFIVVAVLWLARLEGTQEFSRYDIVFTGSVAGLDRGSTVRENGIPVGRVVDIALDAADPKKVQVMVELGRHAIVNAGTKASLEMQGLAGGYSVEITSGSTKTGPINSLDARGYPIIPGIQSGLQQVVTSAPEVLAHGDALVRQLTALLANNQASLTETLDNLRKVSGVIAGRSGDIDHTISDAAAAAGELRTTLAQANETLVQLRKATGPGSNFDQAIRNIGQSAQALGHAGNDLAGMVQENRPALRDFSQRGLLELQQLLVQTRGLVTQLNALATSLDRDPARLLYGNRREGYRPQ